MIKLTPLHSYLISVGCFIVSKIFAQHGIAAGNYIFAAVGFLFLGIAIRSFFKKRSATRSRR